MQIGHPCFRMSLLTHQTTEEGVEQSRHVLSLYAKKPVQGSDSEPFVNSLTSFGGKTIIAMECLSIDEKVSYDNYW